MVGFIYSSWWKERVEIIYYGSFYTGDSYKALESKFVLSIEKINYDPIEFLGKAL